MPEPLQNASRTGRRRFRWWHGAALGMGGIVLAGLWPVTSRGGVNYVWSTKQIPLYEKAINFLSRDLQTRRLVKEITAGAPDADEKILRIFSWVTQNIHPVPAELPVVDDHPSHILIRGYGAEDQRAEAFALLASYAGFPSTAVRLIAPGSGGRFIIVSLVQYGTKTLLADVDRGLLLKDAQGALADLDELASNPRAMAEASQGLVVYGIPYERYFQAFKDVRVSFSRMERQKPWHRVRDEGLALLRSDRRAR